MVKVRARAVVVACGSLETPALLRRSGLVSRSIGRNLHLHPAFGVLGVFEEAVRAWESPIASQYSDEHADLTQGYGVKYETGALHPSLFAASVPWRSAKQFRLLMEQSGYTLPLVVFLRDRGSGVIHVGRDGHPTIHYRLSAFDRRHARVGLKGAARILEAAGARRIYTSHARLVDYEPGRRGGIDTLVADADACGWGSGQCSYSSVHPMSTARMGDSCRASVCDPTGTTWEVRNLVVADASALPSAPGVNPMITIEALGHMNARRLAAQLT